MQTARNKSKAEKVNERNRLRNRRLKQRALKSEKIFTRLLDNKGEVLKKKDAHQAAKKLWQHICDLVKNNLMHRKTAIKKQKNIARKLKDISLVPERI